VAQWDGLEALVIDVYRRSTATPEDETEFRILSGWLRDRYTDHRAALVDYWPATQVAGAPAQDDPFRRLFEAPNAAAFVANWPALQALPAAREALNRWLIALASAPTTPAAR
jgi:hypothetical protein